MTRPNILYLHSHDTGRYIQPYGYAIPTPNLQRLAEGGVLFRQAFCGGPTCSPSRACLLTGQCAHRAGMLGLAHLGFELEEYGRHLVHTLKKAGYHTALSGVQHVAAKKDVHRIGYDQILSRTDCGPEATAASFLENAPRPFFLSVGFGQTHRQFPVSGPDEDARYTLPPGPLPDTPETRHDMACFKTSARMLDAKMGVVLDALEAAGLAGNTLVICTTDHGIAFPRMKCTLTDSGIGVMLIMRGPGGFGGGRVVDSLVSHLDVFPTLCDLAGISPPDWLEGSSIMPLIRGETGEVRDEIYAEVNYHVAYEPQRGVRTRRWKYIRRYLDREMPVLPNCDNSPSKTLWMAHGWAPRAREELYDLLFDPCETNNRARDPAAAQALADMRARLDRWMMQTDDPLLQGDVAAPPGAVVRDAD